MHIYRDHHSLTAFRAQHKRIAFIPTMGALHAGHLSLVELAQNDADAVLVSIFVNPTQFGPAEDFSAYPRQEEADLAQLENAGVAAVYLPTMEEIYPNGPDITEQAGPLGDILCGTDRPGHFDGVLTVVRRLFALTTPDSAIFGEKDYQQLVLIRQMVAEHTLPITILAAPTARAEDGLALSSRNAYLSDEQRAIAPLLYRTLSNTAEHIRQSASDIPTLLEDAVTLLTATGFTVHYLELQDDTTLAPLQENTAQARLFAAATLGPTRLIDNVKLS